MSPDGNEPLVCVTVYPPPLPPDPDRVWLYGAPCSPGGSEGGLILGAIIVTVYVTGVLESATSVAVTVKVTGPAAVGVPVIWAVGLFGAVKVMFNPPFGRPLAAQVQHVGDVVGSSLAVKVWLYATPTSPPGSAPDGGEITGCPHATPPHTTATTTAPAHLRKVRIMAAPGVG